MAMREISKVKQPRLKPKCARLTNWTIVARLVLILSLLSSQGALAADVGDILFQQRTPTILRRQASPRERSAQERQASWQAREVIEGRIPPEIRYKYGITDALYAPRQRGRVVANDLLELPPFSRARVALRTYCLDRPLPAPTSGEKLHVIEVHKLLLREFIPIYESLMSYSALHPEKNLQIQRIVWVMRFLSEGLDIPAFDLVAEDERLLEEIHPGSVGVIENRRRRIRLQRKMWEILDQALPQDVRGVLRELSRFGFDIDRPPQNLRTADGIVARTLEIINTMRPTGPILEDNSEYTLLSNDVAVKTEHPGGASRTTLIVANPTPETKTLDFKRYALQSGRDTQRLGIGGIDSVEWPDAPPGNRYAQYLQLPWRAGDVWEVTQGYHEHQPGSRADDCYAIDFAPLSGRSKSVFAMRGGKAVAIVGLKNEKRPHWCPSYAKWNPPFRSVVVTHDDGTKAEYWHLDRISSRLLDSKGNPLPNGVEIKQGEYLGEMGSSGCASGPHLHIILRRSGEVVRIPGFEGTIIASPLEGRENTSPIIEEMSSVRTCDGEGGYIKGEQYLSNNIVIETPLARDVKHEDDPLAPTEEKDNATQGASRTVSSKEASETSQSPRGISSSVVTEFEVPLGKTAHGFTYTQGGMLTYRGKSFSPPVVAIASNVPKFRVSILKPRNVAGAISMDVDGKNSLFLLDLISMRSTPAQRTGMASAAQEMFWSPSQRYLVALCAYEGERFIRIDLNTRSVLEGDFIGPRDKLWRIKSEPRWVGQRDVLRFIVTEHCNPYGHDPACTGQRVDRVLATYEVHLDAATLRYSSKGIASKKNK